VFLGINVHKAQNMENVLSNVLKTSNREPTKSTMFSSTSHPSSSRQQSDITHAWLLVQCMYSLILKIETFIMRFFFLVLKSQGISNSENYLQKIIQAYPKFTPLLHTKVPQHLFSTIWNDPVMKQLALIFSNKRDQSSNVNSSLRRR
jgi:hypothetical protein